MHCLKIAFPGLKSTLEKFKAWSGMHEAAAERCWSFLPASLGPSLWQGKPPPVPCITPFRGRRAPLICHANAMGKCKCNGGKSAAWYGEILPATQAMLDRFWGVSWLRKGCMLSMPKQLGLTSQY